jgi:hypothetical protein
MAYMHERDEGLIKKLLNRLKDCEVSQPQIGLVDHHIGIM